jgi:hypothetical protein
MVYKARCDIKLKLIDQGRCFIQCVSIGDRTHYLPLSVSMPSVMGSAERPRCLVSPVVVVSSGTPSASSAAWNLPCRGAEKA